MRAMTLKVFLSHSLDPAEQALAWRLQTLAAAHGIEMYVPRRGAPFLAGEKTAAADVENAIDRSDCVLAIITAKANAAVQKELKYAHAKRKLVIPIVQSDLAASPLIAQFPRVFIFSPWDNAGKVSRQAKPITCGPGGTCHDYVPFYFGPLSVMLLNLKTGRVQGYDDGRAVWRRPSSQGLRMIWWDFLRRARGFAAPCLGARPEIAPRKCSLCCTM